MNDVISYGSVYELVLRLAPANRLAEGELNAFKNMMDALRHERNQTAMQLFTSSAASLDLKNANFQVGVAS